MVSYLLVDIGTIWVMIICSFVCGQYRLFWTDIINSNDLQLQYYCLYRHQPLTVETSERVHEITPYCFRSKDGQEQAVNETLVHGNASTFEELRTSNVTSEQLYTWLAPIDLIERYELFLNDPHGSTFEQKFYNCTSPWFGLFCELSLNVSIEFSQFVQRIFSAKLSDIRGDIVKITNYTCYEYIVCDRGPEPVCLDWREICDGKRDCEDNGADEANCEILEANECRSDEYRCHNGLCVPAESFGDSRENPDCLDGSDEPESVGRGCTLDPAFACEERTCRHADQFSCGDGYCIKTSIPTSLLKCMSERDGHLSLAMTHPMETPLLNRRCYHAIICATRFLRMIGFRCDCEQGECPARSLIDCPSQFVFPGRPVMFGHVYFVFENNRTVTTLVDLLPDYICYDSHLCPFLLSTIMINGSTCRYYHDFDPHDEYMYFSQLIPALTNIFHTYCSVANKSHCHEHPSWFHCDTHGSKCIPHHRRLDGIFDCPDGIDEQPNGTCAIKHPQRLKCSLTSDMCIAPISILDGNRNCPNGDDEKNSAGRSISFQTLCDRFQEIPFELNNGRNESDETDCEFWQCNNTYNRCDGVYNCLDEIDEANCPYSLCDPFYHACVSDITKKFTCLPMAQVNDNEIDCIGGSDERQYCRDTYPDVSNNHMRFQCQNDSQCLQRGILCDNYEDCLQGDDEIACEINTATTELWGRCIRAVGKNRTLEENLICNITDEYKRTVIYFSLNNAKIYPLSNSLSYVSQNVSPSGEMYPIDQSIRETTSELKIDLFRAWYCYRGILVYEGTLDKYRCFCPPSYYGDQCQYQSQRVSLTIQFRKETAPDQRAVFHIIAMLMDSSHQIHSYDSIIYVPSRDCNMKHNIYLLYQNRPKDALKNYTIRIDVFNKTDLVYYMSWFLKIPFAFLPVNRISTRVRIPAQPIQTPTKCSLHCQQGQCTRYGNTDELFCRCFDGWNGGRCNIPHTSQCATGSICAGSIGNRSICICPLGRFGPRCLLRTTVRNAGDVCKNGGQYIPVDDRLSEKDFTCLCAEGFSGPTCETINTRISIAFKGIDIPSAILAHFIRVFPDKNPVRSTLSTRIPFDTDTAVLFTGTPFHIMFVEIKRTYYLAIVQEIYAPSNHIETDLISTHRCVPISEVLNSTILQFHSLRRIKFYQIPCQERSQLACFHDEQSMCLCDLDRYANCFQFDHDMNYNCTGQNFCENDGQCFQDDSICPKISFCSCTECFYGKRCQFSAQGFDLSLDAIIGYSIYPNIPYTRQPAAFQVSIALTTIFYLVGSVNGFLSIITFQAKSLRKVGCGFYLLTASIVALVNMNIFLLKLLFLILTQLSLIRNPIFLRANCITMDFLLKFLLNSFNWLTACVAIERAVSTGLGIHFDQLKSRRVSKWIITFVLLFISLTAIVDPIHRHLIDDEDEQRIWCIVTYPTYLKNYTSIMNISHFIIPFLINLCSAFLIIIITARTRSAARKNETYKQHLRQQLNQHKHLLITPCVLVILALPRLIISLAPFCMKSTREPWLFLSGYFIAFLPHISTFLLFVVPSSIYMNQFKAELKQRRG